MPSSPDSTQMNASDERRDFTAVARRWNRKLHYFLGLYFLFFIWLFALTGLVLNHMSWGPDFQNGRKVANDERTIQVPAGKDRLEDARAIMRQLEITGEIEWIATPAAAGRFDFRVNRPSENCDIKVDLNTGRATVQRASIGAWHVTRILHTFTGVRAADNRNQRDWSVTRVWAFAMDAVAVGLIAMVGTSLWMWWVLKGKRVGGAVALAAGCLVCGWLLFGLRWV